MKESWLDFRSVKRVGQQFSRSSSWMQQSGERERERRTSAQTKLEEKYGSARQTAIGRKRGVFAASGLWRQGNGTANLAAAAASGLPRRAAAAAGLIDNSGESVTSGTRGSWEGGDSRGGQHQEKASLLSPFVRLHKVVLGTIPRPIQGVTLTGS
ncbi:hypothetical protein LZ32DRAFT_314087 [Colletotrichum eremochloae]|nr:hypothetical protein LZ32DRAFT_314087 [Colletotrichum eremochloae]